MTHPTHDELVLLYYGESESAQAEEHVRSCDGCASALDELARDLQLLSNLEIPHRPDYHSAVWNRLRWKLGRPQRSRTWIPLTAAAGLVACTLVGIAVFHRPAPVVAVASVPAATPVTQEGTAPAERVMLLVVSEHFDRSSRLLLEISNARPAGNRDFAAEQKVAEELTGANRMYRQVAVRNGRPDISSVLDELEPILLELAHAPAKVSDADLRALQKRIEDRGLVFRLSVMASESAASLPASSDNRI